MTRKIVVIGSGAAGLTAASTIREHDEKAEIDVFTEDEHIAYSPCAVIYVIEGQIKGFDEIIMHDANFYKEKRNISIHRQVKVVSVDPDKKNLALMDGSTVQWDALVLAVGGRMFVPQVGGTDLSGVFTIKTVNDRPHDRHRRQETGQEGNGPRDPTKRDPTYPGRGYGPPGAKALRGVGDRLRDEHPHPEDQRQRNGGVG
jgi:NAD(P)H-nitrite reductase large subunit